MNPTQVRPCSIIELSISSYVTLLAFVQGWEVVHDCNLKIDMLHLCSPSLAVGTFSEITAYVNP